MNKLIGFILLPLFFCSVHAQQFNFTKEIKFVRYLQEKEQFSEAEAVLNNVDTVLLNPAQKDSLYFEKGWFAYSRKQLDTAARFLEKVSEQDPRFLKAAFFAQYCNTFQKRFQEARSGFSLIPVTDSIQQELKNFQLAGLSLLHRDTIAYRGYRKGFGYSNYVMLKEEHSFEQYYTELLAIKQRSPAVAGILSAVVPGLGKVYAGKKKQGLGAFFPVVTAGLLTWEAYNRGGIKDARFWIYGTLFTTFYIGNIWGSVSAVSIRNQELNRSYDNKILFNMHIPLRNFFN